jgi:Reverse transcriptase (RNA-dependent DNA polymerase)
VFTLPNDNASEPYRFPTEFFKTYWDIIRDDLYQAITAFYHNRLDLWCIN